MAYVRTLLGFKPPRRYDSVAFTTARVQESADGVTIWSTLETVALSPVDPDPANPLERNFTTDEALLANGYYRVQWVDASAAIFNSGVTYHSDVPPICTVDDVARLLRADEVDEVEVSKAIETAVSWAGRFLRDPHIGETGTVVETSDYVPVGHVVPVSGTPTSVSVVDYPGADPRLLDSNGWTYDGVSGWLRLRPWFWTDGFRDPRYTTEDIDPRVLTRVDVTTTRSGEVDPLLRDGVALAAAAVWTRSPRLSKGLQGESLGDYSYTVIAALDSSNDPFFEQAKVLLRSMRRRGSLVP